MGGAKHESGGKPTVPVKLWITSPAAYYDDSLSVSPCNWVKVHGPRGHTMSCNVGAGGEIVAPSDPQNVPGTLYSGDGIPLGTGPYEPVLDEHGFAWFLVRARSPALPKRVANLLMVPTTVWDRDDPDNSDTKNPSFQDYTDAGAHDRSNEHFIGYASTTGAPADGVTPCCIYVMTDQSGKAGTLRVTIVTGSATVFGVQPTNPRQYDVPLENDGCAAVTIVDTIAEPVQCTVRLLNVPGTDQLAPITMRFVTVPDESGETSGV